MSGRAILLGALFASLALNVFVVGAFVGARLGEREPPGGLGQHLGRSPVVRAVRTLSPEHRAAWRERAPALVRENGPRIREARKLMRETMRGFGDEPFDADAAIADLRRARAMEYESRVAMDEQLVGFAATLPPADRARFGEALAQPPEGLRRRGAGNGGGAGLADR